MAGRLHREFYLLRRGEQRALIILSLLLILSLVFRVAVGFLPDRVPEGLEEFKQEAQMLMALLEEADSLQQIRQLSPGKSSGTFAGSSAASGQIRTGTSVDRTIDINRADSADLLPLPGIGPVFAGRIIKYRNLLGGFVSPAQLSEVYGIPAETIGLISERISIDTLAIRKIRIDSATFRELLRHPYLEYEDVKALVEYRDFKGDISSLQDLRANLILPDSTIRKMDGYFDFSSIR